MVSSLVLDLSMVSATKVAKVLSPTVAAVSVVDVNPAEEIV